MSSASHAGHTHGGSPTADRRRLWLALLVIVGFMLAEVVVGLLAHSLALLSDAGHMLTDAASIGLALIALRLAQRPPQGGLTYGLKRAEILSALTNGATLLAIAVLIVYEAIRRLLEPPAVNGRLVLVVALVGIVVNLFATWQLARAERKSLNIQGSFQHILTDLYAFIATAVAALVIIATGYTRADPLVSFLIAALMLRAAYGLLRDAGRVLMEAAPAGMSAVDVGTAWPSTPRWSTFTTPTYGRSLRGCQRSPLTCWSGPVKTAMRSVVSSKSSSTNALRSSTPRSRSITRARAFRFRS